MQDERPTPVGTPAGYARAFDDYRTGPERAPLFLHGDALSVLAALPEASVDCCMTSPPYWGQRNYVGGGIGREAVPEDYVARLAAVAAQVRRVIKGTGSFWLNLGDAYANKNLLGLPWRVAFALKDGQGWVLRNSVVWNKVKGSPDNAKDKLRNVHELLFHFVKKARGYYYDVDAARNKPRASRVVGGAVVSATGVRGVRYRRQIELSTALTEAERASAMAALDAILGDVRDDRLADFRMIIRAEQRTTHSDSATVSGRARELQEKGFYFLKYHPRGSKRSDVWDILPEDTQKRRGHFAAYPEDLCKLPILTTCPQGGMVLDPFCGTGTTCLAAARLGRKAVGIDLADDYLREARARCAGVG
ncbi:MAG: site-specific DNA-methyltransferase [Isosphaeraceae bacterium]|nr:site-specific DNA-methyltransferase [Isosphaeraceae bacterium]